MAVMNDATEGCDFDFLRRHLRHGIRAEYLPENKTKSRDELQSNGGRSGEGGMKRFLIVLFVLPAILTALLYAGVYILTGAEPDDFFRVGFIYLVSMVPALFIALLDWFFTTMLVFSMSDWTTAACGPSRTLYAIRSCAAVGG
jgi:hypothetical protein